MKLYNVTEKPQGHRGKKWMSVFIFLLLFGWAVEAFATPPIPPAKIVLSDNLLKEDAILEGADLPIQIMANTAITGLEINVSRQQFIKGKASFEQLKPVSLFKGRPQELQKIGRGKTSDLKIPLKMEKPGVYLIDIRISGKSEDGSGFSDRLIRYMLVDDNKKASLVSPQEYNQRQLKEREKLFLNENQKSPNNHPIRFLFDNTAKLSKADSLKVKPFNIPVNKRLEVRPVGPSEILLKNSIDNTKTSWSAQDPITVRGRLLFQDIDGVWKPLVNVSVNLWDSDFGFDENLGVVCSDWDGRWSFSVNNDDGWWQNGRDIYYSFKLENTRLKVGDYEWESAVHDDLSDGAVVDFGDETASTSMDALQVWSPLNLAWNHAVVAGGWDPGKIECVYPAGGTYWNGKVHVEASYHDGPDVIVHEYAHGIMAHAYTDGDPSPGGSHSFGDVNQNPSLSWSEGWATAFMLSLFPDDHFNWHQGDGGQDLESFWAQAFLGERNEGRVVAALLDMLDANDDDNGGVTNRGRNGARDHNTGNQVELATMLRDTMAGSRHHNNVLEFWDSLSGELDNTRWNFNQENMYYNWMSVPSNFVTCVATKIAVMNETDSKTVLTGLRKFRDLALKNTEPGRELINMYYRNSPEIAMTLLKNQRLIPDALKVMRHCSSIGYMISSHQTYLKMMEKNPDVIPEDVNASVETIIKALSEKGSPELKADIEKLKKNLAEMKGVKLQQLQERGIKIKAAEGPKMRSAIKQTSFNPESIKSIQDQKLQESVKKFMTR